MGACLKCTKTLAFLIIIFSSNKLIAQESRFFTNISTTAGLSSNSVTAIVQDGEGFIWIGTKKGLNRFDGISFKHYDANNSSLTSNDITTLSVDQNGKLWAGFLNGGVEVYSSLEDDFVIPEGSKVNANETVNSIYTHSSGNTWVLAESGAYIYSSDSSWVFPTDDELISISEWDGDLWVGSIDGKILTANKTRFVHTYEIPTKGRGAINRVWSLLPTSNEEMLVGTQSAGLYIFNKETELFSPHPQIEASIIRGLMLDKNKHVWVGTDGNGVYEIDEKGSIHNYTHLYGNENAIASNALTSIHEDKQGNIWFGTAWDGMSILDQQSKDYRFYYSDFTGEKSTGVLSILSDSSRIWLGSDGDGLHSYPSLTNEFPQINQYLGQGSYVQFIKAIDDNYWIGTFKKGLFKINLNRKKVVRFAYDEQNPNSISYNDVRDIVKLDDSNYLIATWGGGVNLYNADKETFKTLSIDETNLTPKNTVTIHHNSPSEVLVGTFNEGLYLYDHNEESFSRIHTQTIKNCVALLSDAKNIWIGTWGEGLYRMNRNYDSLEKLSNRFISDHETILSLLKGSNNGIVFSTKESVFHMSKNQSVEEIKGLKGQYYINAAAKDPSGRYYFGHRKGAISFEKIDSSKTDSITLKLLSIELFNQKLNMPDETNKPLEFKHDENVLTFEYAALNFPSSKDIHYQVKVDPLHNDWIEMGTNRSLTLANLNPNNYTLHVRATSGKNEISHDFIVHKPWWLTWWAICLYFIAFLVLLYLFRVYSVRLEKLRSRLKLERFNTQKEIEIGKLKQKFFVNISHEIRTPLTLIMGEIERLIGSSTVNQKMGKSIFNIRANSNYIMQLVNELLDYRKLESEEFKLQVAEGNIVKFAREIFLAFQHLAENKEINYHFESSHEIINTWYDRDQLEKVFYNLLSNAFKYTESGKSITLQLTKDANQLAIEVIDEGKGIQENQLKNVFKRFYQSDNNNQNTETGFGIGLSIVAEIVRLHKGKITVESQLNQGSAFRIRIPIGKEHFSEDQLLGNFIDSESIKLYKTEDLLSTRSQENLDHEHSILIVEDNEEIRRFIAEVLQENFVVKTAANGQLALDLLENEELPDLIISDVMMPEIDGVTLLKKVKSSINTSHIPILLLTARTGLIFKKEGYTIGADDYITKPFNSSLLKARVNNIIRNRILLRDKIRNEYLTKTRDIDLLNPDEEFLTMITDIVDKNLGSEELDTGLISSELGMSHSVVYKKLKSLTGLTIVEFIRDYRLSQGARLLTVHGLTVAETSYKVGFSDKKYFSQMFKKKFGLTPTDYVKQHS